MPATLNNLSHVVALSLLLCACLHALGEVDVALTGHVEGVAASTAQRTLGRRKKLVAALWTGKVHTGPGCDRQWLRQLLLRCCGLRPVRL
eukprot:scaffold7854_cov76-Phaeocystis_antarctica.AAC.8